MSDCEFTCCMWWRVDCSLSCCSCPPLIIFVQCMLHLCWLLCRHFFSNTSTLVGGAERCWQLVRVGYISECTCETTAEDRIIPSWRLGEMQDRHATILARQQCDPLMEGCGTSPGANQPASAGWDCETQVLVVNHCWSRWVLHVNVYGF